MKRISVTTLETYRKYLAGDPWMNQQKMIEAITTPFQGNEYTRIGSAFHSIVEQGEDALELVLGSEKYHVMVEDWRVAFNQKQVEIALRYRNKLPYAFHEESIGREFTTPSMPIWVNGRMDVLHGTYIRDIKTKYSPVKYSDYADSAQWRFYLDLTGLDTFYFDLFEFPGYKIDRDGYDVSELGIKPYGAIECIRYDGMEADNQNLVNDFTDFIVRNRLTDYLKDKKD